MSEVLGDLLLDIELASRSRYSSVYLDSHEVLAMILGYKYFKDEIDIHGKSLVEFAASKDYLVCAVATAGGFGKINVFKPHQAEVVRRISRRGSFNPGEETSPTVTLKDLLAQIGISGNTFDNKYSQIPFGRSPRLAELFVLVESLRGKTIDGRLTNLMVGPAAKIQFVDDGVDYERMLASSEYRYLMKLLAEERPGMTRNNSADALVILAIREVYRKAVGDENLSHSSIIPRFFDPNGRLMRISSRLTENNETHSLLEDAVGCSFVQSDYLLLRAELEIDSSLKNTTSRQRARKRIENILDQIDEVLNAPPAFQQLYLSKIKLPDSEASFMSLVDDVRQLTVVRRAARQWDGASALTDAIRNVFRLSEGSVEDVLLEAIGERTTRLNTFAESVQKINIIVESLSNALEVLRAKVVAGGLTLTAMEKIFIAQGVPRFGLSPDAFDICVSELLSSVEQVDASGESTVELAQQLAEPVVRIYFADKPLQATDSSTMIVLLALWVTQNYDSLKEILVNSDAWRRGDSVIVAMATSVCLYNVETPLTQCSDMLSHLEELDRADALSNHASRRRANAAARLAFCHTWYARRVGDPMRSITNPSVAKSRQSRQGDQRSKKILEYAINCITQKSAEYVAEDGTLDVADIRKRAYCTNLALYCVVEFGDHDSEPSIYSLMQRLKAFQSPPIAERVWSYRYDDTLARALWVVAEYFTADENKKFELKRQSRGLAEMANYSGRDDVEVREFRRHITGFDA